MRLVFAGTPVFALHALQALVAAGHRIELVLTRPDRPAQRGQKLVSSPVKQWAETQGLTVWQPRTLRDPDAWERLRAVGAEAMVVAAYGLLLPPEVLAIPPSGCLNIHASLLPRWRGAAPIHRAVQAGDTQTGVTIMQMDAGLDTGPMRLLRSMPIGPEESGGSVHDRLAGLGAEAIVAALERLAAGDLPMTPQPAEGVTYAAKIGRADSVIDWSASARSIADRIRAFDPSPGCVTEPARAPGTVLKVWRARPVVEGLPPGPAEPAPSGRDGKGTSASGDEPDAVSRAERGESLAGAASPVEPGTVLGTADGVIVVACGRGEEAGAVALLELQRPGGRRMPARDFLAGFPLRAGDRLGPPATGQGGQA
jgi:methionyl-tRNA formyltransferase